MHMIVKSRFLLALVISIATVPLLPIHAQNVSVLTWHNDVSRTGQNLSETVLTPTNVNSQSFGLVVFNSTDGYVDAQPLEVANLKIGGATVNVLYVATENDSVYAFNAVTGALLWKVSVLLSGETASDSVNCGQITPKIGITSTPVIDPSQGPNGAIYVVSMSKDSTGAHHQRINALDLTTGAQLFGGPTTVQATYPGTGDNSTDGAVVFDPTQYAERTALLEWNGAIYTAWTSHCDTRPYTAWIMGYSASTLRQTSVLNVTPNGNAGGIWMGGAGLAATPSRIFLLDGNGTFDTTLDGGGMPAQKDYGNGFLALDMNPTTGKLQVSDYYETDTTVQQSAADTDLGSGGALLLPGLNDSNGVNQQLAVGAGKDGNIYVDNMGKYHPNGGYLYQLLPSALSHGEHSAPAYFNGAVYFGGSTDYMRAFPLTNALMASTPSSLTTVSFPYPGTTPSISANGNTGHIIWAISHTIPSVLYAFDPSVLSREYYDTNQAGTRDQFGTAAHFGTPMVANGYVYVGTTTGVAVFGLLSTQPAVHPSL
jgi:hypothetical protein